ncbi:hypothetical protein DFJ73DRAFT_825316 [Zopfochytrium polystomum]|nr:hypothetical protein DFJ73DRAFT_825316 [Zopfochytrium polystomum]
MLVMPRLYQEKKEELEREAKLVKDGSHPALIPLLQQIEAKHEEQIKFATATLDRKEQSFHDELQSAIDAANLEYKRKKARIRHEMVAECVQQRIQLQEEYRKFYQSSIRDRTVTSKRRKTKKLECLEWEMMLEDDYFPSSVVNGLSGPKISEDLDLFQL